MHSKRQGTQRHTSQETYDRARRKQRFTPAPSRLKGVGCSRVPISPAGLFEPEAIAIVDQTYRDAGGTIAHISPDEGLRVRVEGGHTTEWSPRSWAPRPFFERTAGGDPHHYVSLAAATLDVYPNQTTVDRLASQGWRHATPALTSSRAVVARLTPVGAFAPTAPGPLESGLSTLLQDILDQRGLLGGDAEDPGGIGLASRTSSASPA